MEVALGRLQQVLNERPVGVAVLLLVDQLS